MYHTMLTTEEEAFLLDTTYVWNAQVQTSPLGQAGLREVLGEVLVHILHNPLIITRVKVLLMIGGIITTQALVFVILENPVTSLSIF